MEQLDPKTIEQVKRLYLSGRHSDKDIASRLKLRPEDVQNITRLLPKIKYYYDVKVECMLPATLTYKVLAESPEQAADMIKNLSPTSVVHKLAGRKELKLKVYQSGSTLLQFIRDIFR